MLDVNPVATQKVIGAPGASGWDYARQRAQVGGDVRWGMIFKLGWKLLGFFKLLTIGYCVMMLLQNCVTLGTSQLMGEVTNAIRSAGAPKNTAPAANAPATATSYTPTT